MELLDHLGLGFAAAAQPANLLFCFVGVLLGTVIGVLPGIGPTTTIAMLLPVTTLLSPTTSIIMLAGIYYGAQYGGSTTAILINLPGEPSSIVTAMDGHRMAQQGRAGPALAAAAIASFVAGTVSTLAIALFAAPLASLALQFGPAEYFSLLLLGLIFSVALSRGALLKAIGMIVVGLLLGLVGDDIYTGARRFTLGQSVLSEGIDFVALALGVFALAEIMRNLESEGEPSPTIAAIGSLWPSTTDLRRIVGPTARGSVIGSILGVLPGGGAMLAAFAAYAIERRSSRPPETFGEGAIEGVAAPEAANNAGAQTSFIPMLTLGVPSNAVMALIVGAMIIQGIVPGPNIVKDQPALFWGVIASMWVGNAMLLVLNLPLVGLWVRLLAVPYHLLFPAIIVFASIGVYNVANSGENLYVAAAIGLASYVFARLDCEPTPLLLGFVLGPMVEEHLRRAMMLSRGDPSIFVQRPISVTLLLVGALALAFAVAPAIARRRSQIFSEET